MSKIIKLNKEIVNNLKELFKEENIKWVNSWYGGKRFGFLISNEWKNKNPEMFLSNIFEIKLIEIIQFICQYNPIDETYIKNNNLNQGDINLIKRSYFQQSYDNDIDNKYYLWLALKRPFGNSYVIGDILEEYNIEINHDDNIKYEEKYSDLMDEVIIKIKNYLINAEFDELLEAYSDGYGNYILTTEYLRRKKINKLLNENKQ